MAKQAEGMEVKMEPAPQPAPVPRLNIYQRISAVMEDVAYLQKDKEVAGQYKSVSFAAFVARVRESFIKHGILAIPVRWESIVRHLPKFTIKKNSNTGEVWKEEDAFRTEAKITLRIQNVDEPEDFVLIESFGAGVDPQDKDPGKAFTYAVKSGLMKLLLIETGEGEESAFRSEPEVQTLDKEMIDKISALCLDAKISERKIAESVGADTLENIALGHFEQIVVGLNNRIARIQEKANKGASGATGESPAA